MMGFIIALAIIFMLCGTIGAAALQFGTKHRLRSISWLMLPIGIYLAFYVRYHEQAYYLRLGAPHVSYAQVKGISETRMSVYVDDFRSESETFTVTHPSQIEEINEGDIVKTTYVDGIYRAYIIKVEELVVKE